MATLKSTIGLSNGD